MDCAIAGCSKTAWARTLCGNHYQQARRSGTLPAGPRSLPADVRFWKYVDKTDSCWNWIGSKRRRGYGRLKVNGKTFAAHRYSYELNVGPIPEGLHLDHLCKNTSCVNPDHLEPVTCAENIRRGETGKWQQPWTACSKGHELTDDNVRISSDGRRRCLACYEQSKAARRRNP